MSNYIIFTDSACDLPNEIIEKLDIKYLSLICNFKGKEYFEDGGISLPYKNFYNALRNNEDLPTTSQINFFRFKTAFEPYVKNNQSIIYIAFSSSLSGTYNSANLAKNDLLAEYPNADITIIDSKSASCGQGLLVYKAALMKNEGSCKEDIIKWVEKAKLNVCHFIAVDNLEHLKRGGRISSTSATIGSILGIKPLINVNNNGELKNFGKVKGRKKAIKTLSDYVNKHITNIKDQTIFISHGDCYEDAKYLANMIKENNNIKNIIINYLGLVIGAHTGPDMLAVFFLGDNREP
ncbi:DegV family protein [Clostridium tarantellae]|uniref:DegV family EDD domain-containing protein n=1 Tax=Clostridium tarantellae TaxID=39493 RepID=A0A6I1MGB2_9CLOT|nr:DegV family protein [Clostridium tarantellae]MPQ42566.1 DegV family EDD domain-containing protein [Clostridium tarantellae]